MNLSRPASSRSSVRGEGVVDEIEAALGHRWKVVDVLDLPDGSGGVQYVFDRIVGGRHPRGRLFVEVSRGRFRPDAEIVSMVLEDLRQTAPEEFEGVRLGERAQADLIERAALRELGR